jgi:hypothetical protein
VIALAMEAGRGDEQGEALEGLEGRERERRGAIGRGTWEAVDDACGAGVGLAVGPELESLESERRARAIPEQAF